MHSCRARYEGDAPVFHFAGSSGEQTAIYANHTKDVEIFRATGLTTSPTPSLIRPGAEEACYAPADRRDWEYGWGSSSRLDDQQSFLFDENVCGKGTDQFVTQV
jgi:hypothetical protein